MSPANEGDRSGGLRQLFKGGWRKLAGGGQAETKPAVERRSGKRIELRLPAQACLSGGVFQETRLLDVSPRGLAMESAAGAWAGQPVSVRLSSEVAGVPSFILNGQVVRLIPRTPPGVGVDFAKGINEREKLAYYRQLVLFYLRRPPLRDEINTGTFSGRCTACEWTGLVAAATTACPACGQRVERAGAERS